VKNILVLIAVTLGVLLNSGCSTLADAKAAKGSGTVRVYEQSYDVVWNAVVACIKESNLALVSESKESGTLLAQGAMSAFSYGENVAVFVERIDGKISTRVEVINKRALATNITAADWEGRLIRALDSRLKKT
jgi:outer membrane murein-binding lipoprotein Lpp